MTKALLPHTEARQPLPQVQQAQACDPALADLQGELAQILLAGARITLSPEFFRLERLALEAAERR